MRYLCYFMLLFIFQNGVAQTDTLKGVAYVMDQSTKHYLAQAQVNFLVGQDTLLRLYSNAMGKVEFELPPSIELCTIRVEKSGFEDLSVVLDARSDKGLFPVLKLKRLPGYELEVTLADLVEGTNEASIYGLEGATIEVYNRTLHKEVLRLEKHPKHIFKLRLEQGNEYLFLIRRKGYYAKYLRANVNVNGCILCMEGFGEITPGVVDNLTSDNSMGSLASTVGLKKLVLNERISLQRIYYDFGKANLRIEAHPELDKIVKMMRDNPSIVVELSSHTDSQGDEKDNLTLSQERAESVVRYIKSKLGNSTPKGNKRIIAKGYGETQLVNHCKDGVICEEEQHQQNRRTELKLIDFVEETEKDERSFASILQEKYFEEILARNTGTYLEGSAPEATIRTKAVMPSPLPLRYSGFTLQLATGKGAIPLEHPILFAFDKIYVDLIQNGSYALMQGLFKTSKAAEQAKKMLQTSYPKIKVIEYKEGLRN